MSPSLLSPPRDSRAAGVMVNVGLGRVHMASWSLNLTPILPKVSVETCAWVPKLTSEPSAGAPWEAVPYIGATGGRTG